MNSVNNLFFIDHNGNVVPLDSLNKNQYSLEEKKTYIQVNLINSAGEETGNFVLKMNVPPNLIDKIIS